MIDGSFFKRIEELGSPWRIPQHSPRSLFYDSTTLAAVFLAETRRVHALLPQTIFKPMRLTPWHSAAILMTFEHRDSDAGSYNEAAIAFPVDFTDTPPPLSSLHKLLTEPAIYLYYLGAETRFLGYRNPAQYGFPIVPARVTFKRAEGAIRTSVGGDGRHIFTLTAAQLPVHLAGPQRIHVYSKRGNGIYHAEVLSNPKLHGISMISSDAVLELGDHPLADTLRALGLGRLVQFIYAPEHQALLRPVSGRERPAA